MNNKNTNPLAESPWFNEFYIRRIEKLKCEVNSHIASLHKSRDLVSYDYNNKLNNFLTASNTLKKLYEDPLFDFECSRDNAKEAYLKFGDPSVAMFYVENIMPGTPNLINSHVELILEGFDREIHKPLSIS